VVNQVFTIPNLLTLFRILLILPFAAAILKAEFTTALLIFFLASISDGLDGLLARRLKQQSLLGQWLDPLADKLLLTTSYILLTLPGHGYKPLPLWLTLVTILRDFAIVVVALVVIQLTGFRDFKPSKPGKLHTAILLVTILAFLATHALGYYTEYLVIFYWVALLTTIFSGIHYVYFVNQELIAYRNRVDRKVG
jgi:cardiolipin synthase